MHRHRRICRRRLFETLENRSLLAAVAPPDGIVSWWTGDNTTADLLGRNDGALSNGGAHATGQVGDGFNFDGDDDNLQASTDGFPIGSADRTIELWARIDQQVANESFFASYGAPGLSNQAYALGTINGRVFVSTWGPAILGPTLENDRWYHVAVTNVGNSFTLYLDGVEVAAGSMPVDTPAGSTFWMGRQTMTALGDARRLDGMVDEVTVYDRALNGTEIQAIYSAGSDGKLKSPNYFAADFPSVIEGPSDSTTVATFTIKRTGDLSGEATVNWATADGTAFVADSDYVAASGTVVFQTGESQRPIDIIVNGDNLEEADETFNLVLTTSETGYAVGAGVASILNDDVTVPEPGPLDPSFDGDGVATYSIAPDQVVGAIVLQPVTSGSVTVEKILVGGHIRGANNSLDFYLARYNSDGSPDSTFGTNGVAITDFAGGTDSVSHLLITSQGKILAIGQAYSSGGLIDVGIARYTANGVLDNTYGTKGKVTAQFMGGFAEIRDSAYAAVLDGGDRLVIAGQSSGRNFDGYHRANYVARFTASGALDKTFGKSGKVVSTAIFNSNDNWGAITVNGVEIIVVGEENRLPTVARFGERGALLGKSTLAEAPGDVVFLPGGAQFVGARTMNPTGANNDIQLRRFNVSNGTIDTTFGTAGRTLTDFSTTGVTSQDTAHDVTIDAQGRILVAGYIRKDTTTYGDPDFLLVRYNSSGHLDTSFGSGGAVVTSIADTSFEAANRVLVQADGRILLLGSSANVFVLARYLGEEAVAPAATESSAETSTYDDALAALLVEEDIPLGRRRK